VAGYGPLDADTCRDLADRLAAGPRATWCVTLTDPNGRAAAHACAKPGTGSARSPGQADKPEQSGRPLRPERSGEAGASSGLAWVRSLSFEWLERAVCTHERQTASYRPGRKLRHLVKARHRTCVFPGCHRPAQRCDLDHTTAYDQGGRTCECNLSPTSK
jgi:hypothetical protein